MNNSGISLKDNLVTGYSPISLLESPGSASPQRNLTGYPRVIKDMVADLYNTIQLWNSLHIKGSSLVKAIAITKSEDVKCYPPDLDQQCENLFYIVQKFQDFVDTFINLSSQISALTKLKISDPLFISLTVSSIASLVEDIRNMYSSELQVKRLVLENIAHSKSKHEAMFLAAYWTYQTNITDETTFKLETLLVETGHRKYS